MLVGMYGGMYVCGSYGLERGALQNKPAVVVVPVLSFPPRSHHPSSIIHHGLGSRGVDPTLQNGQEARYLPAPFWRMDSHTVPSASKYTNRTFIELRAHPHPLLSSLPPVGTR